ncbi:unnamed protein product, partial [Iphiclides podalirius]
MWSAPESNDSKVNSQLETSAPFACVGDGSRALCFQRTDGSHQSRRALGGYISVAHSASPLSGGRNNRYRRRPSVGHMRTDALTNARRPGYLHLSLRYQSK